MPRPRPQVQPAILRGYPPLRPTVSPWKHTSQEVCVACAPARCYIAPFCITITSSILIDRSISRVCARKCQFQEFSNTLARAWDLQRDIVSKNRARVSRASTFIMFFSNIVPSRFKCQNSKLISVNGSVHHIALSSKAGSNGWSEKLSYPPAPVQD